MDLLRGFFPSFAYSERQHRLRVATDFPSPTFLPASDIPPLDIDDVLVATDDKFCSLNGSPRPRNESSLKPDEFTLVKYFKSLHVADSYKGDGPQHVESSPPTLQVQSRYPRLPDGVPASPCDCDGLDLSIRNWPGRHSRKSVPQLPFPFDDVFDSPSTVWSSPFLFPETPLLDVEMPDSPSDISLPLSPRSVLESPISEEIFLDTSDDDPHANSFPPSPNSFAEGSLPQEVHLDPDHMDEISSAHSPSSISEGPSGEESSFDEVNDPTPSGGNAMRVVHGFPDPTGWIRKTSGIAPHLPLSLYSLTDTRERPPYKLHLLVMLAIYESVDQQLRLVEIYDAIADRFSYYRHTTNAAWQRSIRHTMTLRSIFVNLKTEPSGPGKKKHGRRQGQAKGAYWVLNSAAKDETRPRKRNRDRSTNEADGSDPEQASNTLPKAPVRRSAAKKRVQSVNTPRKRQSKTTYEDLGAVTVDIIAHPTAAKFPKKLQSRVSSASDASARRCTRGLGY
ncbi:hypothetical protein R3P38DRAFT_770507 [Favolaschia claudopus]|uniref:Fork-head domain-containing protein n=1 Tax=Favolaschia claudopus TaxID=2862362 RepID=A0AAW0C363_9AGAR